MPKFWCKHFGNEMLREALARALAVYPLLLLESAGKSCDSPPNGAGNTELKSF